MPAQVISINDGAPVAVQDVQPVVEVVAALERMLTEAKSGQLRAFAIATVKLGDEAGSLWRRPDTGEHGHALAAAIGYLAHRYNASMAGDR